MQLSNKTKMRKLGMLTEAPYEGKKDVKDRPRHLRCVPPPEYMENQGFREWLYNEIQQYANRKGIETEDQGYQEWRLWIGEYERMNWEWDPNGEEKQYYLSLFEFHSKEANELMKLKKREKCKTRRYHQ